MARPSRDEMRQQLKARAQESNTRKDAFSGGNTSYFRSGLNGVQFFGVIPEGKHMIDIIPFQAGALWPTQLNFGAPGLWVPYMEIFVHTSVGPTKGEFVCPQSNWGKRCPICEHQARLRDRWTDATEKQKDILKSLYPRRRCVYNIICYDNAKEEQKGVQVLEMAHWNLQRYIEALAEGTGGQVEKFYADPDEGYTVCFTRQGRGALNTSYIGHSLERRDYKIPDSDLDEAHQLDQLLNVPLGADGQPDWQALYDAMRDAFMGSEPGDEEETLAPSSTEAPGRRNRGAAVAEEAAPQRSSRRAEPEPEETPRSSRRAAAAPEDETEERPARRSRDEEDDAPPRRQRSDQDDQDEQEAAPRRQRATEDETPPRRQRTSEADEDAAPPRRQRAAEAEDTAPPRRQRATETDSVPAESSRRRRRDEDD